MLADISVSLNVQVTAIRAAAVRHCAQELSASLTGKMIRQTVYLPLPKIHPCSQVQDVALDLASDMNMFYKYMHYHVASVWHSFTRDCMTSRGHGTCHTNNKSSRDSFRSMINSVMWVWD